MGFRVFTLLGVVSLLLATAASPASDPSVGQADVESDTKYEAAGEEYAPLVYGGGDSGNPGWVTALFWNGSFVCTASLVDPQLVITAAHCVTTPGTYTVLIGEESLLASGITRTVTEIRSHPGFGANFNDTDLALLALNAPVTTVPLATLNTTGAWPEFGQPLAVMGWGEYFEGSGASLFLQGGAVYATSGMDGPYDPYYCNLDPWAMQQGEMFCYGGAVTVKACHGDSGGPIYGWPSPSASSGEFVVYGVVSYGPDYCGPTVYDGVAQSVGAHAAWIQSTVDSIIAANEPPVMNPIRTTDAAGASKTDFKIGEEVTLAYSFIDPDATDTHTVAVSWGDGAVSSTGLLPVGTRNGAFTHVYDSAVSVEITVSVADSASSSDSMTTLITVTSPVRTTHHYGAVDREAAEWILDRENGFQSFLYGNPGDYPFMGDWDCDGDETPGLYRQSDGYVYLRNSNSQGIADIRFYFGNPNDVPIAGDFNGDGCGTVSIYRPNEGRFYVINELGRNDGGLGAADYAFYFGDVGDKPFVGDFNGDGIDTVGLHRETTGLVYYRDSNTTGVADNSFIFGDPGDRLFAGDWTMDGVETPAVYRKADGYLYFKFTNSTGAADADQFWQTSGDRWPISGYFGPLPRG